MSKTDERTGFLAAIEANEEDWTTRLVYADWLEENDEPEEADRQRAFRASYEWLHDLASQMGETCENYGAIVGGAHAEERWVPITYKDVVEAGINYVAHEDHFVQVGSEQARNLLMYDDEKKKLYWKHWQVVTGGKVPPSFAEYHPFSCSC